MLNKITFLLLFLSMLSSCNDHKKMCSIKGKLENAAGEKLLFLVDFDSNSVIDTIRVTNGEFYLKFPIDIPKLFVIRNERNKYNFRDKKVIWLEPSEITFSGDFEFLNNVEIIGSQSHSEHCNYLELLKNENNQINKLIGQINDAVHEGNIHSLTARMDSAKLERNKKIVHFLIDKNSSYVTLSALYNESFQDNMNLNKKEISFVFEHLETDLKETANGKFIFKYLNLPKVPQLGEQALEIKQCNPDGDTIRLSDFKGKYVFIDFWASWCAPCRDSNNKLVKVYNKYNSKGFEILGISGDKKKEDWINSINRDSLKWENISDLNGWHNEAFLLYHITRIPSNILIDPKGKIIGKNYCSMSLLDDQLNEILNKQVL